MKRGSALPDSNHVTRHVPWSKVMKDEDSNAIGILPQAVALRSEETYLSVDWNEYYLAPPENQVQKIVQYSRGNRTIKPKDVFAVAQVGQIKAVGKAHNQGIRVYYAPTQNPAHSAISQYDSNNTKLLEALADMAFVDLYINSKIV